MRILTFAIAMATIIASGVAHGLVTSRWGLSQELKIAAARLREIPSKIGDWTSEDLEIPKSQLKRGEIENYVARRYVNVVDQSVVNVVIVCGRPGPIAVHTPDVCFQGTGNKMQTLPAKQPVETDDSMLLGELWVADFTKTSPTQQDNLRVYWTWSADGVWRAPNNGYFFDNPRWEFAAEPFLYKMYVTRGIRRVGESEGEDLCIKFLRQLIPQLKEVLFRKV